MLHRKFESKLEAFLSSNRSKILLVNGARQIGKSYIIRYVGKRLFKNFVEIDLKDDFDGIGLFKKVKSTQDFYIQISALTGGKLGDKSNTLIFLDEIQTYPHLLTMLKFLNKDNRYTYIASGSQLGVALAESTSVPIGTIEVEQMFPLDFEEFLWAADCGTDVIELVHEHFKSRQSLPEPLHDYLMRQFRLYLLVGGMPEAVNYFLQKQNIKTVRTIQKNIIDLYKIDASQYDSDRKLLIRRIYDMIPSALENKKKRIVVKNIEQSKGHKQYSDYADEWEYLIASGIALSVKAISNPVFPLIESEQKNLQKLYLNDVGLLTSILYDSNINAILDDECSINLGTVYESVVAQELNAHGFSLHYYDNKKRGEVDYIIDDFDKLSLIPIEVKSGKDYTRHSALSNFLSTPNFNIKSAIVFYNKRTVYDKNGITYMPIYFCMSLLHTSAKNEDIILELPKLPTF